MRTRSNALCRAGLGLALLAALMRPAPALANGRFPAASQLVVAPGDPREIMALVTYGVLSSRDSGRFWDLICETGIGYGGDLDPVMAMTADGSLIVATWIGLAVGHGDLCNFSFADPLVDQPIRDVATDRSNPARAVLALSRGKGGGVFQTQVWQSLDNAKTFTQLGVDLPTNFRAETLEIAPSDAQRVYLSGLTSSATGTLMRSSNGGTSWERFDIPGSTAISPPFIGAVDPQNADTIYVRLNDEPGDRLLITTDGGRSFSEVFTSQADMLGFALSPDGSRLVVGGPGDGVLLAQTAELMTKKAAAFQRASDVRALCLTWTDAGIYACGNERSDGFTIGLSTDLGSSFTTLMHLCDPRGVASCPVGSTAEKNCATGWPAISQFLQSSCASVDGGAGAGGALGAGGGGTAGSTDAAAGSGGGDASLGGRAGSSGAAAESAPSGGCGCRMGSNLPDRFGWTPLALLFPLLFRRRRSALS